MKVETEFKVLMYKGQYVNSIFLDSGNSLFLAGMYTRETPTLYSKNETIESLIERLKRLNRLEKTAFSDIYFDNLSKCELVKIIIEFEQPKKTTKQ
jgi:hypothetical protein